MGSSQRSRKPSKRNKKSRSMKNVHAARTTTRTSVQQQNDQVPDHTYALLEVNATQQESENHKNMECSSSDINNEQSDNTSDNTYQQKIPRNNSASSTEDENHCEPTASTSNEMDCSGTDTVTDQSWGTDEEFNSIMAHQLETEMESPKNMFADVITGNRIVNLAHVLDWAIKLQTSHSQICTCGRLYLWKEVKNGLVSSLHFKCTMCNRILIKTTDVILENNKLAPLNVGAVWGTLAGGGCHAQLEQLLTAMDVPSLTFRKFSLIEKSLGKAWHDDSIESMTQAGQEEHTIALQKGDVDADGIPFITVCLDGGWSKRSYGHNYNAASGAAVIIGKETNKVLFLGVRNKFCYVCAKASNNKVTPDPHVCFRNWEGSSSAMEADIIVEGFTRSVEMHNLRYKFFIADGDSSTFAKLRTHVPYGNNIQKIECKNHAIKNYSKHLYKIKDEKRLSVAARKPLTVKYIKDLVDVAKRQISHNSEHGTVTILKQDLSNGLLHIFGQHRNCAAYYCSHNGDTDEEDKVPELKSTGLFQHIEGAMELMLKKAHLLIQNENNNRSEHFMSLLAKYNAGKRLNLTMRGSFQNRCTLSALSYNTSGPDWQQKSWKKMIKRSPGKIFKRYVKNKNRGLAYKRANKGNCRKSLFSKTAHKMNQDYGVNAVQPELPVEVFTAEFERTIKKFQVTPEEREKIANDTVGQFGNHAYEMQRQDRLTSSLFGKIIKRPDLYHSNFHSDAVDYGLINEQVALKKLERDYGIKTEKSGLFIDLQYGFLASSPDGLIDKDGLVEIKCLYTVHKSGKTLKQAAKDRNICVRLKEDDSLELRRNHNYYFQIQGQLNICNRDYCYFVVYINEKQDLFIEKIYKDSELWTNVMCPKLVNFYMENVFPEIIRRRVPKKLKCMDSEKIQKAIQEREKKMPKTVSQKR